MRTVRGTVCRRGVRCGAGMKMFHCVSVVAAGVQLPLRVPYVCQGWQQHIRQVVLNSDSNSLLDCLPRFADPSCSPRREHSSHGEPSCLDVQGRALSPPGCCSRLGEEEEEERRRRSGAYRSQFNPPQPVCGLYARALC